MDIAQKICQDAVKFLKDKGWGQNTPISANGSLCLAEALSQASDTLDPRQYVYDKNRALSHVNNVLFEKVGEKNYKGMVVWNDTLGRTKEEVIALLELAVTTPVKED